MSLQGAASGESIITSRNDITRRLMLAGSAAAGGLATAVLFLLLRNAAGDDSKGSGDDSSGGGFTTLPEWPKAFYPLVNDALRDLLRRMEHPDADSSEVEFNRFRSITIKGDGREYPKQVTLTITERGWLDDEAEGVVMRYRLEKSSDGWRITGAEGKKLMQPGINMTDLIEGQHRRN
jgi:hypothetical protein